jgi:hypothetical protein
VTSPPEDGAPAASPEDDARDDSATAGEQAARRRALLADLDLLPETTSDEAGGHAGRSDDDYRSDRPPHHGD